MHQYNSKCVNNIITELHPTPDALGPNHTTDSTVSPEFHIPFEEPIKLQISLQTIRANNQVSGMCITYFLCNKVGVVLLGLWIVFSNTSLVQSTNACFHTTQSIGRTTKEHNNYSKSLSWIENRLWYVWYAHASMELQETAAAETNHHHHSNLHTSGMYNLKSTRGVP